MIFFFRRKLPRSHREGTDVLTIPSANQRKRPLKLITIGYIYINVGNALLNKYSNDVQATQCEGQKETKQGTVRRKEKRRRVSKEANTESNRKLTKE